MELAAIRSWPIAQHDALKRADLSEGVRTVQENVIVSHRGARYEIGRGPGFYGIWPVGAAEFQPIEWWPETGTGWQAAWSRFSEIEPPSAIHQVGQPSARFPGEAGRADRRAIIASALLGLGAAVGIVGLFPGYFGGTSLVDQAEQAVPHAIYLAVWAASAVLIVLGGTRQRTGALLAAGTSIVTLGFFVADAGSVVASSTHVAAGLVLSLISWAACAAGSVLAIRRGGNGSPARPATLEAALTLGLAAAAGLGAAIAFAPSWDSFTLRTVTGTSQTFTAGNAFANPGLVIAGDVAVMVALVAVAIAAGAWRPMRLGAILLAGAVVPMAAQAISAVIQISRAASPAQFGIPPAEAAGVGLTISSGLTLAFWIYCGFVAALILTCALMLNSPVAPPPPPVPVGPEAHGVPGHPVPGHLDPMDATSPAGPTAPGAQGAQTIG
jgi:hypothetical protein